jgi:hypothetical protein
MYDDQLEKNSFPSLFPSDPTPNPRKERVSRSSLHSVSSPRTFRTQMYDEGEDQLKKKVKKT